MPEIAWNLTQALAALGLLTFAADTLVRGASALALRLGISPLAVGLTIVAFGTSAPELMVSLGAALQGSSDIAVGNVVGSNICNIALILGLAALVRPTAVHANIFRLDAPLMVVASLVLAGMLTCGGVPRIGGAFLLAGLFVYTAATLWRARRESDRVRDEFSRSLGPPSGRLAWELIQVVIGLAGLVLGGQLLVSAALRLAVGFGVSEAVIGLTIVAVGTSLPELATSVVAAARGQGDLALGNVVGSNLFNILGILGTTAVVHPLGRGDIAGWDLGAMVFLAAVLVPIARTGMVVSRIEGAFLVLFYVGYVTWLIAF